MVSTTTRSNSIDLLIGPYRTGKTRALLQRVVDHCIAKPEEGATIVVPSHRYRTLLHGRLAEICQASQGTSVDHLRGFAGLRVLTFYQCCERLLRQSGTFVKTVPDTIRPGLIGLVLSKLRKAGQAKTLDPVAGFPGTPAALLELVD